MISFLIVNSLSQKINLLFVMVKNLYLQNLNIGEITKMKLALYVHYMEDILMFFLNGLKNIV